MSAQATTAFQEWLANIHGEDILSLDEEALETRWSEWKCLQRGDDGES